MHDPAVNLAEPHHDAEELLPWYATGQLDGEDLSLVEQHLSNCAHCRRQLAFERGMVDEFARLSPEIDSGWTRLRQRVEAPHRRETPWARLGNQAIELWHSLNRPAIATLAFAQLAFVVVVGALFLSLGKPDYRALPRPNRRTPSSCSGQTRAKPICGNCCNRTAPRWLAARRQLAPIS